MEGKTTAGNKLMKLITIPIRALGKARDLYVKSMNSYADKGCYGGSGFGYTVAEPLPRSFSTNSGRSSDEASDDLRELIRAASSRAHSDNKPRRFGHVKGVPRSASVSMAKIDEDKAYEFEVDDEGIGNRGGRKKDEKVLFPRSRTSYVVSGKRF